MCRTIGLVLAIGIVCLLVACDRSAGPDSTELQLADTIFDERTARFRTDTVYAPDSDTVVPNTQLNHRGPGGRVVYPLRGGSREGVVIRNYEPGLGYDNVVQLPNARRMTVAIRATDVELGGQRFRVGIMRPLRTFDYGYSSDTITDQPDYLVLTPYGVAQTQLSPAQDNVGPITKQTVFRVGRRAYHVAEADFEGRRLTVRPLEDARGLDPTARLEVDLKRVPVRDLDGEAVNIRARPGRELVIYFWGLSGTYRGQDVIGLDTVYATLPEAERNTLDIVLVNRLDAAAAVRAFVEEHDVRLPVYTVAPNTCRRLNCSPDLPYWVWVSDRGRVISYHNWPEELFGRLQKETPHALPG